MIMLRCCLLLIVTALTAESPAMADTSSSTRIMLVVSKTDHTLELRDARSLDVLARVPVGPDPHEVQVTADGRTAYVSNPGYGAFHRIDVIDLVARKAETPIDTFPLLGPHGLAWQGRRLWFTAQGSKAVGRYDPAAAKLDWVMGTGQDTTHLIHVTPDGRQVFASNSGSASISLLKLEMVPPSVPPTGVLPAGAKPRLDWVHTRVPTGPGTEGFDVSPDQHRLWTVGPDGIVYVLDTVAGKVIRRISTDLVGAHRLKFTPDGRRVMVVSVKTGAIAVFDATNYSQIARLQTGRSAGLSMDPAGNRAFVSCTPDDFVSVIDLTTLREIRRIPIGRPDGVAMATVPRK